MKGSLGAFVSYQAGILSGHVFFIIVYPMRHLVRIDLGFLVSSFSFCLSLTAQLSSRGASALP